jgi:hypothetical protein
LCSVINAENVDSLFPNLINENVRPSGKHKFARARDSALAAALRKSVESVPGIKDRFSNMPGRSGVVFANIPSDGRRPPEGSSERASGLQEFLDVRPHFGLFDEITPPRGILADFDSGDKVSFRCQAAEENVLGNLIRALPYLGGNCRELRCLLCGEFDFHDFKALSQLLWPHKDREVWFSLEENHEKGLGFGLHQLRNRFRVERVGGNVNPFQDSDTISRRVASELESPLATPKNRR